MKYLSLAEVLKRLPQVNFPVSELEAVQLKQAISQVFTNFSTEEIQWFIELYQSPDSRVMMDWIEADHSLRKTLFEGKVLSQWKDVNRLSKHQLFGNFRMLVDQFLYPIVQRSTTHLTCSSAASLMSYSYLLSDQNKERLQDVLGEWYLNYVQNAMNRCNVMKKDQFIYQQLTELFSEEFVQGLNLLDERHYGVKMQVLEKLTTLMYHRKSSVRLVIYIVNQLCRLELKQEHIEQLRETEKKVRSGQISVEKSRMPWLRLSATVFIILLAIGAAIGVYFIEAKTQEVAVQEETSFMEFSQEERNRLDSLIGNAQTLSEAIERDKQLDQDIPFAGQSLIKKREWTNTTIKSLYHQWSHNDSAVVTNFFSKSVPHTKPYVTTRSFAASTGSHRGEFHNNTLKSVLVLVFTDTKKSPVFTKYVHAKSTTSWHFTEGDYLIVVPGCLVSNHQQFGDLPFKELNQEFYDNLNVAYQLKYNSSKKVKLVWETLGTTSYLVDLNNALDKI
jgi:hypothetical protein